MQLFDTIRDFSVEQSSIPAIIDDEKTILWEELPDLTDRICLGLVREGMRRSRGVGLLIGRRRQLALSILGIMRGGAIAVPLLAGFGIEYVRAAINLSKPQIIIYEKRYAQLLKEILLEHEFRSIICISDTPVSAEEVPWQTLEETPVEGARFPIMDGKTIVYHNYAPTPDGSLAAGLGSLSSLWHATIDANRGMKLRGSMVHLNMFTAGLAAHEAIVRMACLGGTAVYTEDIHPSKAIPFARKHKVNTITAPACYYHLLCDWATGNKEKLDDVRLLEARGHVSDSLAHRVRQVLGTEIIPTWSIPAGFAPLLGGIPTGYGAPAAPMQPYPGYQARILDDKGADADDEESGALHISGTWLANHTLDPDNGKQSVLNEECWYDTGYRAYQTKEGETRILGSRFDLMLRNDRRVYPQKTALALEGLSGVMEATALVIDRGGGILHLVVAAFLVPGSSLTSDEMLKYLSERLHRDALPDEVITVAALPRYPDGNVNRERLREML